MPVDRSSCSDIEVQALGGFVVKADGCQVQVPSGNVEHLFCMVVSAVGSGVVVDVAIDELWPDADLQEGRRRLRNVLSRTRRVLGPIVVRRVGGSLHLGADVRTDVEVFLRLAHRALSEAAQGNGGAAPAAFEALAVYGGRLLPHNPYSRLIEERRRSIDAMALAVLDVAVRCTDEGRMRVEWLLGAAIRVECLSPDTFSEIAHLADRAGAKAVAWSARSLAESTQAY